MPTTEDIQERAYQWWDMLEDWRREELINKLILKEYKKSGGN